MKRVCLLTLMFLALTPASALGLSRGHAYQAARYGMSILYLKTGWATEYHMFGCWRKGTEYFRCQGAVSNDEGRWCDVWLAIRERDGELFVSYPHHRCL